MIVEDILVHQFIYINISLQIEDLRTENQRLRGSGSRPGIKASLADTSLLFSLEQVRHFYINGMMSFDRSYLEGKIVCNILL